MRDYRYYAAQRERDARRRAQDARDAARARAFDLSAQDRHHKYERPSFAVVGEGSPSAQTAYREGWERIFGSASGR